MSSTLNTDSLKLIAGSLESAYSLNLGVPICCPMFPLYCPYVAPYGTPMLPPLLPLCCPYVTPTLSPTYFVYCKWLIVSNIESASLFVHGYHWLPLSTIYLVGDNREFEVLGIFRGLKIIVGGCYSQNFKCSSLFIYG